MSRETCPECGETLYFDALVVNGHELPKVARMCKCQRERQQAEEQRLAVKLKQDRTEKLRRQCFQDSCYSRLSFGLDDKQEPQVSRQMRNYAMNFEHFRENGQGLLLYGRAGTGKSFYAACIANELIEHGYSVYMSTVSDMIARIQRETFTNDVLGELGKYDLLIIDDLGAESDTSYRQEKLFDIVDKRYRNNLPIIVSTNLTAQDLAHPHTVNETRVFGRIIERCMPIAVNGLCRRSKTAGKEQMARILNQ